MADKVARRWLIFFWLLWRSISIALGIYSWADNVSEKLVSVPIDLIQGNKIVVNADRVFQDRLVLSLEFKRVPPGKDRPELGDFYTDKNLDVSLGSAADVRIEARVNDGPPATFEALPKTSSNALNIWRDMNSVAVDGKWHMGWSSSRTLPPYVPMKPGRNSVSLEVTKVDMPLVGEQVDVQIEPPYFLYTGGRGSASIFDYSFITIPLLIIFQVCWGLILLLHKYARAS